MIIGKKAQDGDIIIVDFHNDFEFRTEKPKQVVTESVTKAAESKPVASSKAGEKVPLKRLIAYVCIDSGMQFETEEFPNSTVICPFNAKEKTIKVSDLQIKEVKSAQAQGRDIDVSDTDVGHVQPTQDTSYAGGFQAAA